MRIFSSCGEQRATLYSQGSGFSLRRFLLLGCTGSRVHGPRWLHRVGPLVAAPGLRSTGSIDWCTGLAALRSGIFPGQGVNLETEDYIFVSSLPAFPGGSEVKASAPNAGDPGSVGEMPWRRKWQPTPIFVPGEALFRGSRAFLEGKLLLITNILIWVILQDGFLLFLIWPLKYGSIQIQFIVCFCCELRIVFTF